MFAGCAYRQRTGSCSCRNAPIGCVRDAAPSARISFPTGINSYAELRAAAASQPQQRQPPPPPREVEARRWTVSSASGAAESTSLAPAARPCRRSQTPTGCPPAPGGGVSGSQLRSPRRTDLLRLHLGSGVEVEADADELAAVLSGRGRLAAERLASALLQDAEHLRSLLQVGLRLALLHGQHVETQPLEELERRRHAP